MPKRINAIPTEAADFAEDDFIPIDGAAGGTRKLRLRRRMLQGIVTASGLTVTVAPFRAQQFGFGGGSLNVVASGTWFVGVELYRQRLIALPRLGHRGWIPVARVVASATEVTSIEPITPELPASRLPNTLRRMRSGEGIRVLVLGSSLAEGTATTNWSGMLFNASSSEAAYKLPNVTSFANYALGGAPNSYMLAQLGWSTYFASQDNILESGWPHILVDRSPPNGRSGVLANIDLVVMTCLANGGEYRLSYIEPIVRRIREQGVEVILLTDNPQNPASTPDGMLTTLLYSDGPEVMRIAERYGVELADTAAYVAEQHLRYGSGIYGDAIHMSAGAPAGPSVEAPACGHEVYARAIRSLITTASQPVGTVVTSYDFADSLGGFAASTPRATVSLVGGKLVCAKITAEVGQWGTQVAIPPVKAGDTVRVQGTVEFAGTATQIIVGVVTGAWASSQATTSGNGSFDFTVTLTSDIASGGRVLFLCRPDAADATAVVSLDNVTITVHSTFVQAAVDTVPGRAEVAQLLPPCRLVTDMKTPGDAFVILPKDEHRLVSAAANAGTLGAHPNGANSFARRFCGATGTTQDLLTLTTGQRAIISGVCAVGFSLIRYSAGGDSEVVVDVSRSGSYVKSMSLGAGAGRESLHAIVGHTELGQAAAVSSHNSYEITVTSGTLKIAALVAWTADVEFRRASEMTFGGTWGQETTVAAMPGYYSDTPGSTATLRVPQSARRVGWMIASRTNSKPLDFYNGHAANFAVATAGVNHIRVYAGPNGGGGWHTIKLTAAAASPIASNRSVFVAGAVLVNDR